MWWRSAGRVSFYCLIEYRSSALGVSSGIGVRNVLSVQVPLVRTLPSHPLRSLRAQLCSETSQVYRICPTSRVVHLGLSPETPMSTQIGSSGMNAGDLPVPCRGFGKCTG